MIPECALIQAHVVHKRLTRPFHRVAARPLYLFGTPRQLTEKGQNLSMFKMGQGAPVCVRPIDITGNDQTIEDWARLQARRLGGGSLDGPVYMLTQPRLFGMGFNPLTVLFLTNDPGGVQFVLYQVRNTFGGRHLYGMALPDRGKAHTMAKAFHVSPFLALEGQYRFAFSLGADRLALSIALNQGGKTVLRAHLWGQMHPLTNRALALALLRRPALPVTTYLGIHWHALRLWFKGARFFAMPKSTPIHPPETLS